PHAANTGTGDGQDWKPLKSVVTVSATATPHRRRVVPANVASKRTIAARRGAGRAAPLERCTATPPYKNGPGRWSRVTRPTLTPVQWAVNRARRSVSTALRPAGPRVTYWCH